MGLQGDSEMLKMTQEARDDGDILIDKDMYRRVTCPSLIVVGGNDAVTLVETSHKISELTGGDLHVLPTAGHGLHTRFSAKFNTIMFWTPMVKNRTLPAGFWPTKAPTSKKMPENTT